MTLLSFIWMTFVFVLTLLNIDHLRLVLQTLREHQLFIKMPNFFWGRKETKYLAVIVGNGTLRTAPDKIAAVRDWPLPETQKQIKYFVQFCSFYGKFIHHFSDKAAPQTDVCRKHLHVNVVQTEATKDAFKTLKARMISASVLYISKAAHDAEFVVATEASKVGIAGVLLQEDMSRSLRTCSFWARKLKYC